MRKEREARSALEGGKGHEDEALWGKGGTSLQLWKGRRRQAEDGAAPTAHDRSQKKMKLRRALRASGTLVGAIQKAAASPRSLSIAPTLPTRRSGRL